MKKQFFIQLFGEETAPETTEQAETAADQAEQTKEEPEKAAEPKADEKKYSDKDLDEIINKKFAKWQADKDKELDEAAKLAGMNAQEKAEHLLKTEQEKLAAAQKELEEYKRKDNLAAMAKTARKILADEGVNISDELLSVIVTAEADTTKANVTSFVKTYKADVEAAVKARLAGTTPTVGTGSGTSQLSEIDKRLKKYE